MLTCCNALRGALSIWRKVVARCWVQCSSGSFKMSANFVEQAESLKGDRDWSGDRRRQCGVSYRGLLKMVCMCAHLSVHVSVKISMSANRRGSAVNSPGLFTQLSKGSDMLARRRLPSLAYALLTSSSRCLTFSFSFVFSPHFLFPPQSWPLQSARRVQVRLVLSKREEGSAEIRALGMLAS